MPTGYREQMIGGRERRSFSVALAVSGLGWLIGFLAANPYLLDVPLPNWMLGTLAYVLLASLLVDALPSPARTLLLMYFLGIVLAISLVNLEGIGWENVLFGAFYGSLAFVVWTGTAHVLQLMFRPLIQQNRD